MMDCRFKVEMLKDCVYQNFVSRVSWEHDNIVHNDVVVNDHMNAVTDNVNTTDNTINYARTYELLQSFQTATASPETFRCTQHNI